MQLLLYVALPEQSTITSGSQRSREGYIVSSTKEGARARRNRTRAAITTAAALVAAAAFAGPASADLAAMSPDLNLFGFPAYYADSTGLQVGLCIEDPGCPASPPASDMVAPDGEAFYQLANATVTAPGGKSVTVDFNVEGAYLDDTPITFGRIQFTARGLTPGATYTVDHPYGTSHFTVDAKGELLGGKRAAQREETDGSFNGTLGSSIGPFLRSTSAPAGYLGNGVTETTVTGGPLRNTMTVTGPGLPEAVTTTDPLTGQVTVLTPAGITTDRFVVEGKQFDPTAPMPVPPPPVAPDQDRDGTPNNVDLCIAVPGPANNAGCPLPSQPTGTAGGGTTAGGTVTNTIVRVIPGPSQAVLFARASSVAVSRLTLARRISMSRLRAQGLRTSMQVKEGTNVVRIAIYKARGGHRSGRALFTTTRTPRSAGLFRVTLRSSKLSQLKPGQYMVQVRAGGSAITLSAVRQAAFTVTR
jgi:hypothetical protein